MKVPSLTWGYRRKAVLHARQVEGAWALGMLRRRGREEEFIPIPDCPIHVPGLNSIFCLVAARVPADWPMVFVMASGQAVTLVIKSARVGAWLEVLRGWASWWPAGWSLFVNWNPSAGYRVLDSKRTELVLGESWLEEGGLWHGPVAFRQQIAEVAEAAVAGAVEFLAGGDSGLHSVVVDFYCGLGASLREWERLGAAAVGVELSGESLAAAAQNAPGALLLRGRVEDRLPQVDAFVGGREFVLYTNPPRGGQGELVNQWVLRARPSRVAYLSCNPRSLGADLRMLAAGYEVLEVRPFDFFPHTPHVEALALLRRRE